MKCCVPSCYSNSDVDKSKLITFHKIPKHLLLRNQLIWKEVLNVDILNLGSSKRICSRHFEFKQFTNGKLKRLKNNSSPRQLKKKYTPSLKSFCSIIRTSGTKDRCVKKESIVKQEILDTTEIFCKMTSRDRTIKNGNDLELKIMESDAIKSEVVEIKSEPLELDLEEQEIGLCFTNSEAESVEHSSHHDRHLQYLNGELMLKIFEYPNNSIGSKSQIGQNLLEPFPHSDTNTSCIFKDNKLIPSSLQTPSSSNKSTIKVTKVKIPKIDCSKFNITGVKIPEPSRDKPDSQLKVSNFKIAVPEIGNSEINLSNYHEPEIDNFWSKHSNLKVADTTSPNNDTSYCDIRTFDKKKRKLHEISDPLSDEEEEKRRLSAINAKRNRESKKTELEQLREQISKQQTLNANLMCKVTNERNEKKIALLEKENAELRYQILLDKYNRLLESHANCSVIK